MSWYPPEKPVTCLQFRMPVHEKIWLFWASDLLTHLVCLPQCHRNQQKSLNDLWPMASNLQKGRKDAVNSWNSLPKQKTKWSDEKYQARANIIGLPEGRIPPLAHELSWVGPFNSPAITAARGRCHASKTTCYKQRRIDDARGSKDLAGLGQRVQQQTRGLNQWKPGLDKQKVTWPTNSNVYQKKVDFHCGFGSQNNNEHWIKDDKGMDPKDLKPPVGQNFQPKLVGFTL